MSVKHVADLMTRDVAVINRNSDVHELEKLLLDLELQNRILGQLQDLGR